MEKTYSLDLEQSTQDLVENVFAGRRCYKCGKPAARIIDSKFLCHTCATPYNSKKSEGTVKRTGYKASRNKHLMDDEYW